MRRLVAAANSVRWRNPAPRAGSLAIPHEDHANQVLAFTRELDGNLLLVVVNLGERSFGGFGYGVRTGGHPGSGRRCCAARTLRAAGGTAPATPSTSRGRRATGTCTSSHVSVPEPRRTASSPWVWRRRVAVSVTC